MRLRDSLSVLPSSVPDPKAGGSSPVLAADPGSYLAERASGCARCGHPGQPVPGGRLLPLPPSSLPVSAARGPGAVPRKGAQLLTPGVPNTYVSPSAATPAWRSVGPASFPWVAGY